MLKLSQTARYQEKREAILAAAALRFNEHGVRGATLAHIAASVGLVTNSVTYYYRKKEDLAKACLLRSIEAYAAIAHAAAGEADLAARLGRFFRGHVELLADVANERRAPLISFNDIRALPAPLLGELFDAYTAMFRGVRGLLRGAETGHLGRHDLNARAHLVLSIANWLDSWMGRFEPSEYARVADRVTDLLLRGIGSETAVWAPPAPSADDAWRPAEGDATSEAFLRAATVLVNEQGYRGASVDRISARLNVTKGSFYHHHDNKLDLIAACFERTFSVMRQAFVQAEDGIGSGWSRACAASCALVRFQLSDGGPLLRASATSALPDEAHRRHVRTSLRRLTERMNSVVVDGLVDGSVRPLDPAVAAQVIVAAINAAAELQRWVPTVRTGSAADLYVRPAFEGLLCPGVAASVVAQDDLSSVA